jgi:prevent-host-death family protein
MEKRVSAADARRGFSELLRGVRMGRSYVITSHGRVVAKLIPADTDVRHATAARAALLARLRSQPEAKGARRGGDGRTARRRWTRDGLYDDR